MTAMGHLVVVVKLLVPRALYRFNLVVFRQNTITTNLLGFESYLICGSASLISGEWHVCVMPTAWGTAVPVGGDESSTSNG